MATRLSEIHLLRENQQLLEKLCEEFELAAVRLDSNRTRIKKARVYGTFAGVAGAASALYTFGVGLAFGGVATLVILLYALSTIVKEMLNSREFNNVERHWASLKDGFTTDTDIPRKNKAAIADWARQNLTRDQADAVIRAIEKYTSDDLRSSERLKQLDSKDVKELLESLCLLVAADFNIFEIFLGAVKEKDDPGGAVRHILRQMRDYQHELKYRIEAKKREEEEKRRREEEEKRRREKEEKKQQEEEEKRRREKEEKKQQEEEEKRRREEEEKKQQEEEEKRRREEEEKKQQEEEEKKQQEEEEKKQQEEEEKKQQEEKEKKQQVEEEKKQQEEEEKRRRDVHGVHLNVNIPPSTVRADLVDSSSKAQPDDLSPEQFVPADASLEPVVRWDIVKSFDSSGGTMQKERSQVVLQIPPHAVKPNLFADVCLAVCTDVEKIHHLFSLGDCDFVASPMVEVSAGTDFLFERQVKIILPHCLPKRVSPAQLIVYRASADSKGKRVLWKVPAHQDQAGDRPSTHADVPWDDNATFSVTDDRKIVICTRRFSSYTCIQCGVKNSGLPLLFVVGSGTNKVTSEQTQTATVDVHIWDRRLGILDFANNIQNRVTDAEQMTIDLSGVDRGEQILNLRLDVMGQYSSWWEHCRGSDGLPSLPEEQKFHLKQVLGCNVELCTGNDKMKPFVVHWKLQTSKPTTDLEAHLLECAVHITFLPGDLRKDFPIELKGPLISEQLMELPLPLLKRQLHGLGLSSDDIEAIVAAEGNDDEDRVKRRLIDRTEEIRGEAPSLDALTRHLGIDVRSRPTVSSASNTIPKQVFRP